MLVNFYIMLLLWTFFPPHSINNKYLLWICPAVKWQWKMSTIWTCLSNTQALSFPTHYLLYLKIFFSHFFFCIDSYTLDDLWAFLRAHNTIGKTSRTYYSFSDPFLKTEALVILPLTLKCASQLKGRPGRVSKKLRDTERKHSNGKLRSLRGEEAYTHISIRNILS